MTRHRSRVVGGDGWPLYDLNCSFSASHQMAKRFDFKSSILLILSVQKSWDEHLTRAEVLLWFKQLLSEFDLFLITEDMDRSLAFAHLEFGIPIDDLLNVAVNQANDYHAKPTISPTTKVNLR